MELNDVVVAKILNKAHYFLVFIVQIILNQHFEQRHLLWSFVQFINLASRCGLALFLLDLVRTGMEKAAIGIVAPARQKVPTGAWGALLFGFVPTGTGGFVLDIIITVSLCLPFLLLLFFELLFGLDSSFCWPPPLALCNPRLDFLFCVQ